MRFEGRDLGWRWGTNT